MSSNKKNSKREVVLQISEDRNMPDDEAPDDMKKIKLATTQLMI